MSQYINRKEAIDHFEHTLEASNNSKGYNEGWCDGVQFCIDFLNNAPTADVRPNVHGEWINEQWTEDCILIGVECDNCHIVEGRFYDFCPNCGADMRGKKNELS